MRRIDIEVRDDVAYVTLSRPEVRNAFDEELVAELTAFFAATSHRTVVLAGAGVVFCAGADIDVMRRSMDLTEERNRAEAEALAAMFRAIDECPCPVVARVQGAAMGGGLGLVACCDIVVCADDVKMAFSEVRLGIVPAVISTFVLPKIGPAAARRYFVTGEPFGAVDAYRLGLVHEVVAEAELDARVAVVVGAIKRAGPRAARIAKRLVREVSELGRDQAIAHTTALIAGVRVTDEAQEGLRAFLEKRKPGFSS